MSSVESFAILAADASHVAAARSAAQGMARGLEFDPTRCGRVAIAVSEAVSNMLKHAGGGTLAARSLVDGGVVGMEVLAIDSGPGMESVADSARDGVSSTGTAGGGLGAMRRQSDEFEVYSRPAGGTIVRMMFWAGTHVATDHAYEIGAVCIPKPGEDVCGDAWGVELGASGATFLVADGLGHGPDARRASAGAVEVLREFPHQSAVRILDAAHQRLRPTRGAAVAVLRHDAASGEIDFAGVGNISGTLLHGDQRHSMVSHNGIVGHNARRAENFRYPWARGGLLVIHSDGLETQWDITSQPGLTACHASVIAAFLYRQHSRNRDDCTVVVARSLH